MSYLQKGTDLRMIETPTRRKVLSSFRKRRGGIRFLLPSRTPKIGQVIDDAMRAIEKENPSLKNVLPKNYASPDLDKCVLGEVVDLFTNEVKTDGTEASKDLLGRTYEYCIAQFASYGGTKGFEFYTPSSIVKTIVSILKPFDNCRESYRV